MSSYVVLARKWRPGQFADIVGQAPIVRTLMNAIAAERIHHSYLFTGSRGIGKTSIARIFSKAIRCENRVLQNETLISCDQCSNCQEIKLGTSVDVIEIDGASNNGVDAVREIRENTKYMPSSGSKKIYIIDEVHMLTTAAFNALLKHSRSRLLMFFLFLQRLNLIKFQQPSYPGASDLITAESLLLRFNSGFHKSLRLKELTLKLGHWRFSPALQKAVCEMPSPS